MNDILELQESMLKLPQVDIKTEHNYLNGAYARTITIPKGVVLVGAKHLTRHSFIVSKGTCVINDGDNPVELKAPYHGITEIGTKRSIFALTETVFTTIHITTETDLKKLEQLIIEPEGKSIANNGRRVLT